MQKVNIAVKNLSLRFLNAYELNKYLDVFLGKSGAYKSKYPLNTPFEAYYGAFT